ncbi:MAG: winged helix-turn-helix domain-containing protein [Phascolarctobacterium sp.]|nr:winged helix-turn-helix domain-containing protein [Phascolarctobacterium sp.]
MKKNIGFVNLDSSLLNWLLEKLASAPSEISNVHELSEALKDLGAANCSSLMIELNKDGAVASFPYDELQCGPLLINARARKVLRDNVEILLTPTEFDILYFLARNKGEVFTKEQIYKAVWEEDYFIDDSNIMAFIRKLRKKIEPSPDDPVYILTICGIGYKFNEKL